MKKTGDFVGYSDNSLQDAIDDALSRAEEYLRFEIVESQCLRENEENRQYRVTLATFSEPGE